MHKILKLKGVVNLYVPENKEFKSNIKSLNRLFRSNEHLKNDIQNSLIQSNLAWIIQAKKSVPIILLSGSVNDRPGRTTSSRKDFYEENPDQKPPNMGEPSNSTSQTHVQDLQEEPKAKDNSCRDGDDTDEKKQEDQS